MRCATSLHYLECAIKLMLVLIRAIGVDSLLFEPLLLLTSLVAARGLFLLLNKQP